MPFQEFSQIARNGGIGRIRQAEFTESGTSPHRHIIHRNSRQKPIHQEAFHLRAGHFGLKTPPDQTTAGRRQGNRHRFRCRIPQQTLLGLATQPYQHTPLARRQFASTRQPGFQVVGQRQVQIVPSQNEVFPHGDTAKRHPPGAIRHRLHQREIRRSSAHIAHQHPLPRTQARFPFARMRRHPRVECGLRFLQKRDASEPRLRNGRHRQLARHLVEGSRNRDHGFLVFKQMFRMNFIPCGPHVRQIARRDLHGRHPLHVLRPMPRQNPRLAVHAGVAKPRLGRSHQPPRRLRPPVPCQDSHHAGGNTLAPGQIQRPPLRLSLRRLIVERRQRFPPLGFAGRHHLQDRKILNALRSRQIDKRHRRVGGSQVDANRKAGC